MAMANPQRLPKTQALQKIDDMIARHGEYMSKDGSTCT